MSRSSPPTPTSLTGSAADPYGRQRPESKRAEIAAERDYNVEVANGVHKVLREQLQKPSCEAAIGRKMGKAQQDA